MYYTAKKTRGVFDPNSKEPLRISRSKIDLYMNCPFCFYLEVRLGVGQPPGYPFSLNSAVDKLLKKEFDIHRVKKSTHPLMKTYGIDAVPFEHAKMESWRDAMRAGIQYLHHQTNLLITGGIDDVWVNPKGELYIVDYKATSKTSEVSLDAAWQIGYKRQMEVYQWLFRQNGFTVSDTGYFVYCNGKTDRAAFDGKLEFDIKILPYKSDMSWVEPAIFKIKETLTSNTAPGQSSDCDFCKYRNAVNDLKLPPQTS